jgi:hypothetical protein
VSDRFSIAINRLILAYAQQFASREKRLLKASLTCRGPGFPKPPMTVRLSVFTELERAIEHGSAQQRAKMLMQVTDRFVRESARYSDDKIGLFDDVITRL